MTGNPDVGYDNDQQSGAAPSVTECWDAMTDSREHTSSLAAAQTPAFWGHEEGPALLRRYSADMFDAVSDLLNRESEMLKTFERDMHQAMTRFTGAEYDNELGLLEVQADKQVHSIREHTADSEAAVLPHIIGLSAEDLAPRHRISSASTSKTSATPSGDAGTPSASTPPTASAPSDY